MNGKAFLFLVPLLAIGIAASPAQSTAADSPQSGKVWRIGLIRDGARPLPADFWDGMRAHGFVEGSNVQVEARYASTVAQLPDLAGELARLDVDLIIATGTPAAQAAQRATSSIPIVFSTARDPVEAGLVASWGRPGGNLTGVSIGLYGAKLVEILKQALPGISNIAVPLVTSDQQRVNVARAAQDLQLRLLEYHLGSVDDVDKFFATARRDGVGAVVLLDVAAFDKLVQPFASAASRYRMPAIGYTRRFTDAGGLLSYSVASPWPTIANRVARVLNGAKPADLPVEKPTQFELVVNVKAAKALGVSVSRPVLFRATELIQ